MGTSGQEVYGVFDIDLKLSALVLVRPNGMVGLIANIGEILLRWSSSFSRYLLITA